MAETKPLRCTWTKGCKASGIPEEGFDFFACEPCRAQVDKELNAKYHEHMGWGKEPNVREI